MIRNLLPALVATALVVTTASCGGRHLTSLDPASAERAAAPASGAVTDHVIVVSIDGLRPDAIERFGATTLQRLMREGSHSLEASTVLPSKTLPSHTSMLTGTEVDVHGVTWNSEQLGEHGHVATPTIFAAARRAGFETAAFFSKRKFRHLQVPGTLNYGQSPSRWPGFWSAERTVGDAERYLDEHRPNLLFVHLGDADFAGHLMGWMSRPYGWAVREVDEELARLLEAADAAFGPGEYTLLVTADHGGHGRDHGSEDPRDVTIPWIAWGEGVARGVSLDAGISTMDTAGTTLWLLGIASPAGTVGRAVEAAFTGSAVAVASRVGARPGS
ncbi:MAG: ectonucleotide pyrophosphatase/phosphodiesterase [Gemmatimonadetes bacterium]|nr:ectonucleotide pyrophosphatase/phosphodiesterase [Gemmatimonadota bacterium]